MKKLISLILANLISFSIVARDRDRDFDCGGCFKQTLCEIKHELRKLNQKQTCSKVITAEDIGTTGYVIDRPGSYCLGEDIVFAPENPINFTPVYINDVPGGGQDAQGLAAVSDGILRGIFVVEPGSGYISPTVTIGGCGTGAGATPMVSSGQIVGYTNIIGGSGYRDTVQPAITIKAPGVILSFDGHKLVQANAFRGANVPAYTGTNNPSSQTPFVVGIYIPDLCPNNPDLNAVALESIYIEGGDGIIDGFSMWGIYCLAHVGDLRIANLTIENCGVLASYYLRPFATYYTNGLPEGRYQNPAQVPFGVGALNIGETDISGIGPAFFTQNYGVPQNRVQSVSLANINCLNNLDVGLLADNTTNIYIANCHFDNTFSDFSAGSITGAVFGGSDQLYERPSILNGVIENCTFNGTSARGDYFTQVLGDFSGVFLSYSENLLFKNCHFDDTSCTFATNEYGALIAGIISSGLIDCTWQDCTFNNVSGLSYVTGFHISGYDLFGDEAVSSHNIRLINCQVSNIQQNGQLQLPTPIVQSGSQALGFVAAYVKNIYFENCISSDIIINGPIDSGGTANCFDFVDGGEATPEFEADNSVIRGCVAQRAITNQGGHAFGFKVLPADGPQNIIRTLAFEDCVAEGCVSNVPTMTGYGLTQGVGCGFAYSALYETDPSYPISYTNCKALHNKGMPSIPTQSTYYGPLYSVGFYDFSTTATTPALKHTYYNCEATDNVYGFLFQNDELCSVRNCRADLNVSSNTNNPAINGVVGAGFTDLGLQVVEFYGEITNPSITSFNLIGSPSPTAGAYNGLQIAFTNESSPDFGIIAIIDAYSGAPDYLVTLSTPLPVAPNEYDTVTISEFGTPLVPLQSFSLFESNRAFANGAGYTHFGANGNYNVIYGTDGDYVPTLTGNLTNKSAIGGDFFPEANFIAHNLSITVA